jgi:hypothetical protein
MIFICYCWDDRPAAVALMRCFEQLDVAHWIDSKELDLKLPLRPQVRKAISKARVVAFLDTPASRASWWVGFELRQAHKLGIHIVAVRDPMLLRPERGIGIFCP